jgi:hypothetical protein
MGKSQGNIRDLIVRRLVYSHTASVPPIALLPEPHLALNLVYGTLPAQDIIILVCSQVKYLAV